MWVKTHNLYLHYTMVYKLSSKRLDKRQIKIGLDIISNSESRKLANRLSRRFPVNSYEFGASLRKRCAITLYTFMNSEHSGVHLKQLRAKNKTIQLLIEVRNRNENVPEVYWINHSFWFSPPAVGVIYLPQGERERARARLFDTSNTLLACSYIRYLSQMC